MSPFTSPHRRYNPLAAEWVLVSSGRTNRPWLGGVETVRADPQPAYDPECYLCPGNTRASGIDNPAYENTFVFTNDFAALRPDTPAESHIDGLLRAETEPGTCRVICYSPRHDLQLAQMGVTDIEKVVDVWRAQTTELEKSYRWVQIFENKGEAMGASNPHPHGQIWAGAALPTIPAREDASQRTYHENHGSTLLGDYLAQEKTSDRVVVDGDEWTALVPYWATWPFETLLLPKRPLRRMSELDDPGAGSLAAVLRELLIRYDNLFEHPFPYSMGWHGAPSGDATASHWQLHAHIYPPLLRSASVRKFMVGYELLAEAQRDLTPEMAADRMRSVAAGHYLGKDL